MYFRLLGLCLLISLCVAMAAAQSSQVNSLNSSEPASAQSSSAESGAVRVRFDSIQNDSESAESAPPVRVRPLFTPAQGDTFCLSLRTYRVARVSADSDVTRPAGYSTCQPSARFQVKTAVESREIPSR